MKSGKLGAWLAMFLGVAYFLAPLIATFEFSLRMRRGEYSFDAYRVVLASADFHDSFLYSTVLGLLPSSSASSSSCRPPTGSSSACRAARPGRVHHPAAAGDPGDRAGVRLCQALWQLVDPALDGDLARRRRAADVRLCRPRPALHVPLGRDRAALDRRAHPDRSRRKPGRRDLDHPRPHHPAQHPLRHPVGAFLTFAIVIGEFTFASLLDRPAFGPYLQLIGANRAYEPSALAIIAFALTWACMGLIQLVGSGIRIPVGKR